MTYTVSITSRGQINIPTQIRKTLNLSQTKKALLSVKANKIIIEPIKDILALGGSLKTTKKPLTNEELHEFVAQAVKETYWNKTK